MARQKGKGTNGRGSIFQDKHGKWWAQLPPDALGKRPKRSAATEKQAETLIRELEREREQQLDPAKRRATLETYLLGWLKRNQLGWREKTHEGYEYVCKHYIIPTLGNVRLASLTRAHVQEWINKLHTDGLAVETIRNAQRRLHTALEQAVKDDVLLKNVASKPTFPKSEPREIVPLTSQEAQRLLTHSADTSVEAILYLALRLGLRRGELLGLLWVDVNWHKRTIHVTGQVQVIRGILQRVPHNKTNKGRRQLEIDDDLIATLRTHQVAQLMCKRAVEKWQEQGLIFPSEVGTPWEPRSFDRQYKAVLKAAGLPPKRIHDLRHTSASLMGDEGTPSTAIRDVLGHTTTRMTDKYTHSYSEGRRRAIESTGRQLKRNAE